MQKPPECRFCVLEKISNGFAIPEGNYTNGVTLVGESLGDNESKDGLPFRPYAAAGSKLEECFSELGVTREQFKLLNIIMCQPPSNILDGANYETKAIEHCKIHFNRNMASSGNHPYNPHITNIQSARGNSSASDRMGFQPVILALGNIPTKVLTGFSGEASTKESISHLRGYVLNGPYGVVVPSYHPSFLRRGSPHLTPVLIEDMRKALQVAKGEYTHYENHNSYRKPDYMEYPSYDDAKSFYYHVRDNPNLLLSYDIETVDSAGSEEDERDDIGHEIIQIQFSTGMGRGIAIPFSGDYVRVVSRILQLPNNKANHNTWNFDNPRLRAKGIVINGRVDDTQWMFKTWHPRLERGLQKVASLFGFPFPWKHLFGSKLAYYGCADVDAVQYIMAKLPMLMQARGVWGCYERHVREFYQILSRASDVGMPVDETKRLEVKDKLEKKLEILNGDLQETVPFELRNIEPRRKNKFTGTIEYGYVREPKEVIEAKSRFEQAKSVLESLGRKPTKRARFIYKTTGLAIKEFETVDRDSGELQRVWRWCRILPFKPSKDQVVRYLKWKQKHASTKREAGLYEVPLTLRDKKETTGKKELKEIWEKTDDPVLEKILEIRSVSKTLNNDIPNWKPSERDGRVHTEWGFIPPTGQLNARRPPINIISKHTEMGNLFRGIIVAPPGRVFVEADYRSFHVATMGYAADDRDYIRFSQLDPHSIFTSYICPKEWGFDPIRFNMSDREILEICKEIKKRCKYEGEVSGDERRDIRQYISKPVVLGNQLGLGPYKLYRQNRKVINGVNHATELQTRLAEAFPKVHRYKDMVREMAWKKKYLMNDFGRIQYFYDVYSMVYNKRKLIWERKHGDDAERCLGFVVQSPAFGMITEAIRDIDRLGGCEMFQFVNTIHDSLIFLPEEGKVEGCIEMVVKEMTKPCKFLVNEATGPEGLRVGVEVSVGKVLRGYHPVECPEGMQERKM